MFDHMYTPHSRSSSNAHRKLPGGEWVRDSILIHTKLSLIASIVKLMMPLGDKGFLLSSLPYVSSLFLPSQRSKTIIAPSTFFPLLLWSLFIRPLFSLKGCFQRSQIISWVHIYGHSIGDTQASLNYDWNYLNTLKVQVTFTKLSTRDYVAEIYNHLDPRRRFSILMMWFLR